MNDGPPFQAARMDLEERYGDIQCIDMGGSIDANMEWYKKETGKRIPGAEPAGPYPVLRHIVQQKS